MFSAPFCPVGAKNGYEKSSLLQLLRSTKYCHSPLYWQRPFCQAAQFPSRQSTNFASLWSTVCCIVISPSSPYSYTVCDVVLRVTAYGHFMLYPPCGHRKGAVFLQPQITWTLAGVPFSCISRVSPVIPAACGSDEFFHLKQPLSYSM